MALWMDGCSALICSTAGWLSVSPDFGVIPVVMWVRWRNETVVFVRRVEHCYAAQGRFAAPLAVTSNSISDYLLSLDGLTAEFNLGRVPPDPKNGYT